MKHYLIQITLCCCLFLQIACNCRLVECQENGEFIKLKLMKDGQNALFGPVASINHDSIRFFLADPHYSGYDEFIAYNDSTKTMDLFVGDGWKYILKIENIRIDTIIGTTVVISTGECGCSSYRFTNVKLNRQNICQDNCEDIIEIQL